jgi:hypothetical protein
MTYPFTRYVLLFFLFCSHHLASQVNTEKLRRQDSTQGVFVTLAASAGLVRGNSEYVAVSSTIRTDLVCEGSYHFVAGNYEMKESGAGKISNKGFLHARTIWGLSQLFSYEGFAQIQFNAFISLKNRDLLGSGLRLGIPPLKDENDADILRLHVGLGAMFEHEWYSTQPEALYFNRFRSTNYLSAWVKLNEVLSFTGVFYAQPLLSDVRDLRMIGEGSFMLHITSSLAMLVDVSWQYNSRPVSSVQRYDIEFRNGLSFSFP